LESKLVKLKGKLRAKVQESLEQESGTDTDESEADEAQEEIKELEDKLEKSRIKCSNLKEANNKLQETISSLVDKIPGFENKIEELESSLSKANNNIKDKEKEITTLKSTVKENSSINPKLFKVLAEELQIEKAKALMLTNKVKQLSEELKLLKESKVNNPTPIQSEIKHEELPLEEKFKTVKLDSSLGISRNESSQPVSGSLLISDKSILLNDQNDVHQEIVSEDLSDD